MKRQLKLTAALLGALCIALTGCGGKDSKDTKSGAANWPNKQIKVIVPWSAGGGSDLAARTLMPYLEKELGVKTTVVNTKGANGWIAWKDLLQAPADGYTIAQMNIPTVYSGYMDPQQKRSEKMDSFIFLANEISDYDCMVVNRKDTRFNSVKEFVEYAKNNEVLAGDNGVGTNKHLVAVNLNRSIPGLKLKYVHQTGWSDTYSALLGGHVDVGWGSVGDVMQAYKDKEVKVLCVFAPKRSKLLPDVPTFNEMMSGLNVISPSDRGFALKAGTDKEIVKKWNEAMKKAISNPEFVKKMEALGQEVNYMDTNEYTSYAKERENAMKSFADILGWNK
ncbi:tripartite tricarboxylate transporter substrate binding protein [Acidaminococcus intestini]|uniref:tripartite tricarboxylate transporter substrate binding protein n=1 Tax=Acidaminococcus intestini TaxID=187327 RepID=UPI003078B88C